MKRRKLTQIKNDKELELEEKTGNLQRKQDLLNTANGVVRIILIAVPLIAIMLFLVVFIHDVLTGNWTNLTNYLSLIITASIGYLFGYLEKSGLKPKK